MALFNYIAIDGSGKKIKGSAEAPNSSTLASQLRKKSITIISAERVDSQPGRKKQSGNYTFITGKRVKSEELVLFYRQLSTMVDAGVQLVDSLLILEDQAENKQFKKVIRDIKEKLQGGVSFSAALTTHPDVFSRLAVSMIKAAEAGGNLAGILDQLATYVEDKDKIDKKIKSASSYPRFILIFFGLVVSGVLFGLVPKFKEIFDSFGAELPGATIAIIKISKFIKDNIIIEVIVVLSLFSGFKIISKSDRGRHIIDQLKFQIPVVGEMIKKSIIARFCRILGTLTKNGVTLVDALSISAETSNNVIIQEAIEGVKKDVTGGSSLARSLQTYAIFPMMMTRMVAVGEESGAMELMLNKIAEFYERQFNGAVESITSIIEPVLMIGLGVLALIVVIALYLPIFQMSGSISG